MKEERGKYEEECLASTRNIYWTKQAQIDEEITKLIEWFNEKERTAQEITEKIIYFPYNDSISIKEETTKSQDKERRLLNHRVTISGYLTNQTNWSTEAVRFGFSRCNTTQDRDEAFRLAFKNYFSNVEDRVASPARSTINYFEVSWLKKVRE